MSIKQKILDAVKNCNFRSFCDIISTNNKILYNWKEYTTKNGDTLVHIAAQSGCVEVIKYFALHGSPSSLEHKNLDGKTPLHIAAQAGQLSCLKFLLSCDIAVDPLKRSDWTPLMLACTKTDLEVIQALVHKKANLQLVNKDGWTPFHIACRAGNVQIVEYLLEEMKYGSEIWKTRSKNGRTPLHTASLHGHLEVVKLLISLGHDVDVKDSCGITPLMDAVSATHNSVAELLIRENANISETDKLGRNMLHLASESGNLGFIQYIMKNDGNFVVKALNSLNSQGLNPLHFACKENHTECVELLLWLDTQSEIKDNKG